MNPGIGKRLLVSYLVGVILMTVMPATSGEAAVLIHRKTEKENSFRRSNRNYSNACELLNKKRTAKVRPSRRSKRDATKWR